MSRPLTIGIDIRSLMEGKRTGIENYICELLTSLFTQDTFNSYVLFFNNGKDIRANMPQFLYPNVRTVFTRYPNKLFNGALRIFKYPKIDKLIGGADILFVPNFRLAPVSTSCKKVTTVHDLSFELYPEFFSFKRRAWHWFINAREEVRSSDAIIAVSHHTKQHIMNTYHTPPEKIHAIYSGTPQLPQNTSNDQPRADIISDTYHLPKKYFLYLGTLEPRKNIEGMLYALKKLHQINPSSRSYKLVIAGGKGWLYDAMFARCRELGLESFVIFCGFVAELDKPYFFKHATAFLYPSHFEGFGFPPLEALQYGCPLVITSSTSSIPEIVQDRAILINPTNIADIARAMNLAITSDYPPRASQNSQNSHATRSDVYTDWRTTAARTLDVLTSVAHKSQSLERARA